MTGASANKTWSSTIATSTRSQAVAGYLTLVVFIVAFGYWAAAAPLAGAIVAPGIVAAAGENISIRHLEGGIVKDIYVREGDRIEAGQPMLELDPTIVEAQLNRLLRQSTALRARAARLESERDGLEEMTLPNELASVPLNSEAVEIIEEQRKEFDARLSRYHTELEILNQRTAALEAATAGLEGQKGAAEEQLRVVEEEVARKEELLEQGLTNRSDYTVLLRGQAELTGQIASLQSQIASTSIQMVETLEQIERLKTTRVEDALSELNTVRADLADIAEQIVAARSVVDRMVVRAPADGIIIDAAHNSVGGIVGPGTTVFELLPTTSGLVIEAHVQPHDVDSITIGQDARLRLTALDARRTPEVSATVIYVGADRRVDEWTRETYFEVRLELTRDLPTEVAHEQIYPGMPAEAYIATGERTFFEYLIKPIRDSFSRAFREN
ncbi:HlyD family type I secretion periplasmic adaptor subunit [Pelagibacterium sp. H642]|uniref:HlyD family type I secretion periplasmic adaptor subunit n=1 Tax=Pelagibacterium sp. H642 TaxID=1881069 RepID=UPI00281520DB|nr:HlyD family type I secretion periplasmic adaptor subunit [Pelagibacterium sp. H642]WMT92860.1 HlyD family type I secretion periplasmic adaptor subunit [Pelagibacterium sp. H642]